MAVPVNARNASSNVSFCVCALSSADVPDGHYFSMIDHRDALRHAVGFVHIVRGQKHRRAFGLVHVLHVRPKLIPALRVEPESRLIQE